MGLTSSFPPRSLKLWSEAQVCRNSDGDQRSWTQFLHLSNFWFHWESNLVHLEATIESEMEWSSSLRPPSWWSIIFDRRRLHRQPADFHRQCTFTGKTMHSAHWHCDTALLHFSLGTLFWTFTTLSCKPESILQLTMQQQEQLKYLHKQFFLPMAVEGSAHWCLAVGLSKNKLGWSKANVQISLYQN